MFDFDKGKINLVYDKARAIPDNTPEVLAKMYHDLASKNSIKTILDLGCGTGRFTRELSDHFSAKVYDIGNIEKQNKKICPHMHRFIKKFLASDLASKILKNP